MATFAISGTRLYCAEAGRGDRVILIHGSASDHRTWGSQMAEFAREFRVTAYSRRYHWPNAEIQPSDEYAMSPHVDDLIELLRSLGGAPAHLVGHSYGAFLALLVAIREPQLVKTLVLIEAPAFTLFVSSQPRPLELLRLLFSRPRTALELVKFGATGVAPATKAFQAGDNATGIQRFAGAVFGKGGYDRLPEDRKAQVEDNSANIRAEILGPGFERLEPARVAAVLQPALLVDGARSVTLFRQVNDRLEELLPAAQRTEIPGAGHLVHEDNPESFNSAVLAFLGMHSSAA